MVSVKKYARKSQSLYGGLFSIIAVSNMWMGVNAQTDGSGKNFLSIFFFIYFWLIVYEINDRRLINLIKNFRQWTSYHY
jgi:hypothetical protein